MAKWKPLRELPTKFPYEGVRNWFKDISDFMAGFGELVANDINVTPLYAIPVPIIDDLGKARLTKSLFSQRRVQFERQFTELCQQHEAIGVIQGRPIRQTPLNVRCPPVVNDAMKKERNWSNQLVQGFLNNWNCTSRLAHQIKAYAGYLLTEPEFHRDVKELRKAYESLPANLRPAFPLGFVNTVAEIEEFTQNGFNDRLDEFLRTWELSCLATWDLPCPQGPLLPNPLLSSAPAFPRNGVQLFLSTFVRMPRGTALAHDIANYQAMKAKLNRRKLRPTLRQTDAYATLLDVLHLERAISARVTITRRGIVGLIEDAIGRYLKIAAISVKRYRKSIARSLRGDRENVPWIKSAQH